MITSAERPYSEDNISRDEPPFSLSDDGRVWGGCRVRGFAVRRLASRPLVCPNLGVCSVFFRADASVLEATLQAGRCKSGGPHSDLLRLAGPPCNPVPNVLYPMGPVVPSR